jgi:hypothetical protein
VLSSGENVRQGAVGRKWLEFEFYSGAEEARTGTPAHGVRRAQDRKESDPFAFFFFISLWLGEQKATVESKRCRLAPSGVHSHFKTKENTVI